VNDRSISTRGFCGRGSFVSTGRSRIRWRPSLLRSCCSWRQRHLTSRYIFTSILPVDPSRLDLPCTIRCSTSVVTSIRSRWAKLRRWAACCWQVDHLVAVRLCRTPVSWSINRPVARKGWSVYETLLQLALDRFCLVSAFGLMDGIINRPFRLIQTIKSVESFESFSLSYLQLMI